MRALIKEVPPATGKVSPFSIFWNDADQAAIRRAGERALEKVSKTKTGALFAMIQDDVERIEDNARQYVMSKLFTNPDVQRPIFPRPPNLMAMYHPASGFVRWVPGEVRRPYFAPVLDHESAFLEYRTELWRQHIEKQAAEAEAAALAALTDEQRRAHVLRQIATARAIEPDEIASGIVVYEGPKDTGAGLAIADTDNWYTVMRKVAKVVAESEFGKAVLAVRDNVTKSDNEVVAKTFEASGEVRDMFSTLRSKLLPETETAVTITAVRQRIPQFDIDEFVVYMEKTFVPVLLAMIQMRDFKDINDMCTDGMAQLLVQQARARQAANQTQHLQVLDIKRVELHEALLDGQEPQLRFLFGVHQLLYVIDEKTNAVVEGSEFDSMLAYYDLLMVLSESGATNRSWRCARFQMVSQQPTW